MYSCKSEFGILNMYRQGGKRGIASSLQEYRVYANRTQAKKINFNFCANIW